MSVESKTKCWTHFRDRITRKSMQDEGELVQFKSVRYVQVDRY